MMLVGMSSYDMGQGKNTDNNDPIDKFYLAYLKSNLWLIYCLKGILPKINKHHTYLYAILNNDIPVCIRSED
jgi:hypothetical protein